jgi:putative flippase GtrA
MRYNARGHHYVDTECETQAPTAQRVCEESMPDSTTSDSRQRPFSDAEIDEARWMDPTLKTPAARPADTDGAAPWARAPQPGKSYYDTRWPLVNQALEITERLTHGRAGVFQRLFTYLVIGGTAALVNLGVFAIFYHFGSPKVIWYYLLANICAYELSILANFIPNDYFTFRFLPGHQRSWLARCVRFHLTSLSGVLVTSILFFLLYHWLGLAALVAQAIALVLAVFYNFTVHHLFTYAHKQ